MSNIFVDVTIFTLAGPVYSWVTFHLSNTSDPHLIVPRPRASVIAVFFSLLVKRRVSDRSLVLEIVLELDESMG